MHEYSLKKNRIILNEAQVLNDYQRTISFSLFNDNDDYYYREKELQTTSHKKLLSVESHVHH